MSASRKRLLFALLSVVALSGFVASQAEDKKDEKKTEPKVKRELKLFNGKNLDGWKNSMFGGDGEIAVEDGQLILDMGNDITGVTWKDAKELPKVNYEITLEAQRVDSCLRRRDVDGELILAIQGSGVVLVDLTHLVAKVVQLVEDLVDLLLRIADPVGLDGTRLHDQRAGEEAGNKNTGAQDRAKRTACGHGVQHVTNVTNALRTAEPSDTWLSHAAGGTIPACSYSLTPTRLFPLAYSHSPIPTRLFPLDRAGRLGGDVVHHPVDAADLVDDPGGHSRQQVGREPGPVGGHEVLGVHAAQGDDAFVGSLVIPISRPGP